MRKRITGHTHTDRHTAIPQFIVRCNVIVAGVSMANDYGASHDRGGVLFAYNDTTMRLWTVTGKYGERFKSLCGRSRVNTVSDSNLLVDGHR
jgi:hypothetical protein